MCTPDSLSYFVLLAHPRSGTNYFRSAINQHPDVYEAGEIFHIDRRVTVDVLNQNHGVQFDIYNSRSSLAEIANHQNVRFVGYTVFSHHVGHRLSDQEVLDAATKPGMRRIILERRNLLKAYISLQRAIRFGAWHMGTHDLLPMPYATPEGNALSQPMGHVDVDHALEWISNSKHFFAYLRNELRSRDQDYAEIFYEDLCMGGRDGSLREVNKVMDYLGASAMPDFTLTLSRLARSEFYETISNRDELCSATGYDLE